MPGQAWPDATASFLGMWIAMMAAMMLPSLAPMLRRYRQAVDNTDAPHPAQLTALVGIGYFAAWTVVGMAVYPLGAALAMIEMGSPGLAAAAAIMSAAVVLIAGALQLTEWKARHLAYCRAEPGCDRPPAADARAAWRHGLHFGRRCGCSCAGLMAILLVNGIMDLRVMLVVTAAITAERLAPDGERAARILGYIAIGVGALLTVRAVALG